MTKIIAKKLIVKRHILFILSGIMWNIVGLMLIKTSYRWISLLDSTDILIAISIGFIIGIIKTRLTFSNVVKKNINRIKKLPKHTNIFAFQEWKTYVLIVFMISLGFFIRNTAFISVLFKAILYIGIGLALFISGFKYYPPFFKERM